MDDLRQRDPEFTMESTLHDPNPPQDQVTSAFFPNAQKFVVTGGRFKSITNIHRAIPAEPPDFRVIPLGDLDLRHEIRLNYDTGIVNHHQRRGPVRRMHSARIHGSESTMTVAIYEGDKTEGVRFSVSFPQILLDIYLQDWREAISKHSNLRHPNIIQLFGTARTSKIHAAIFHDGQSTILHLLVPFVFDVIWHPDLWLPDTMSTPYPEATRDRDRAQCGSAPQRVVSALI
ncbi:hypothetical protein B0H17DRAFT_699641 [Mycena rosella]|uniref:Protein kinase domain-containing protein n=1 Tax=Mycena rosella TaxID=1033263 RepID=A0AAD7DCD3_MYCRO|nr:hypothetical protein B0H17DRAFT_699641 [Mycena rosella]